MKFRGALLSIVVFVLDACFDHGEPAETTEESLVQAVWYFNELTGSDTADCKTVATACKHYARMITKTGLKWRVNATVDVYFLSDMTEEEFSLSLGPNAQFVVHCPRTVASSGTLTGFTADTLATEATVITDSSHPTWTPGDMVIMTTGAAAGTKMWVAKSLGSGAARVSRPAKVDVYTDPFNPTFPSPAVGDAYQVVTLGKVSNMTFDVDGAAGVQQAKSLFTFSDCDIQKVLLPFDPEIIFTDSRMRFVEAGTLSTSNCSFQGPVLALANSGSNAGLFLNAFFVAYGTWFFNEHPLFQGTSPFEKTGILYYEDYAGFFDVANPVSVWYGSRIYARHGLYGTGISGAAVDVQAGGQFRYSFTTFSFTGQTSDVLLGGKNAVSPVDPTTDVATGTPMTLSFSNILASYPTGFGGSAVDLSTNASFLSVPDSSF